MYRDLKPENVLLDVDGHVKLADFGLSKAPDGPLSYSFCGSPEYMSPEMLASAGHDWRVDLYSLGAILYEMLTGLPPFYNSDTKVMYDAIVNEQLRFPPFLSEAAISLLTELLEKDPDMRLGATDGLSEVRIHPWLKDVDWVRLERRETTPPWVPNLDESNFDSEYTELPASLDQLPLRGETAVASRRGTEFWREKRSIIESSWTSRTVTEQSCG